MFNFRQVSQERCWKADGNYPMDLRDVPSHPMDLGNTLYHIVSTRFTASATHQGPDPIHSWESIRSRNSYEVFTTTLCSTGIHFTEIGQIFVSKLHRITEETLLWLFICLDDLFELQIQQSTNFGTWSWDFEEYDRFFLNYITLWLYHKHVDLN